MVFLRTAEADGAERPGQREEGMEEEVGRSPRLWEWREARIMILLVTWRWRRVKARAAAHFLGWVRMVEPITESQKEAAAQVWGRVEKEPGGFGLLDLQHQTVLASPTVDISGTQGLIGFQVRGLGVKGVRVKWKAVAEPG